MIFTIFKHVYLGKIFWLIAKLASNIEYFVIFVMFEKLENKFFPEINQN